LIPPWYLKIRRQRKCVRRLPQKACWMQKISQGPCSSIGCSVAASSPVTSQRLTSNDRATQPLKFSTAVDKSLSYLFFFFLAFSPSNTPHNVPVCFRAVHLLLFVPWPHPSRSRSSPVYLRVFSLVAILLFLHLSMHNTRSCSAREQSILIRPECQFTLRTVPKPPLIPTSQAQG